MLGNGFRTDSESFVAIGPILSELLRFEVLRVLKVGEEILGFSLV